VLSRIIAEDPDGTCGKAMIEHTRNLRILGCIGVPLGHESICTMIAFACSLRRLEVTSFTMDTLFLCLVAHHAKTLRELKIDVHLMHSMSVLQLESLTELKTLSLNYCTQGGTEYPWTLCSFGSPSSNAFTKLSFLQFTLAQCLDSEQGRRMIEVFSGSCFPGLLEVMIIVDSPWQEDIWAKHLNHFLNYHASRLQLHSVCLTLSSRLLSLILPNIVVRSVYVTAFNGTVPIGRVLSPHIRNLSLGPYIGVTIDDREVQSMQDIFSQICSCLDRGQDRLKLSAIKMCHYIWPTPTQALPPLLC
jgi:hypothetical protein